MGIDPSLLTQFTRFQTFALSNKDNAIAARAGGGGLDVQPKLPPEVPDVPRARAPRRKDGAGEPVQPRLERAPLGVRVRLAREVDHEPLVAPPSSGSKAVKHCAHALLLL